MSGCVGQFLGKICQSDVIVIYELRESLYGHTYDMMLGIINVDSCLRTDGQNTRRNTSKHTLD